MELVVNASIPPPDVLPSLSSLWRDKATGIRLLKPTAKRKMQSGQVSKSWLRWEKYKHATTVGEYEQLGGTSADFLNDFAPDKRYFTFTDKNLERLHLKWLEDGGDVPVFFVHKTVDKAIRRTMDHPAVKEAIAT